MPPHLASVRGPLIGRTFALGDQPLTIGRAADNLVVIASPRASRHHAHIRREGAAFVLYDLGSANGTLVNGQRVQRAVLQPGDQIDIGDEVFRFEAGHQQDATLLSAPQAQPPAYPSQPPTAPAYPPQTPPLPTRRRQRLPPTRRRRSSPPTRRRRRRLPTRHNRRCRPPTRHNRRRRPPTRHNRRRRPPTRHGLRRRTRSRPRRRDMRAMEPQPLNPRHTSRRRPAREAAGAPAC